MKLVRHMPLFLKALPFYLIIALIIFAPSVKKYQETALTNKATEHIKSQLLAADDQPQSKPYISGEPSEIVIPSLGIDLSVVTGQLYFSQHLQAISYTVAEDDANYAPNTVLPNDNQGTTLIYGHWTEDVFGPTKNLSPGDVVYLHTTNKHIFEYTFTTKADINPSNVGAAIDTTGKPRLILMTCDGLWAQERRFMYFDLNQAI